MKLLNNCNILSNYFSIDKTSNNKIIFHYVKKILLNKSKKIKSLLIVIDKWPFFWIKFINNILFFYAHILKVKITLLYLWEEGIDANNSLLSNKFLNKILWYELELNIIYGGNLIENNYDILVFNTELDTKNISRLEKFKKLSYKQAYNFSYLGEFIKKDINKSFKNITHIYRHELNYWMYSTILIDLYSKKRDVSNKKYDLFIAGSIKWRDFELVKYILDQNKEFKICIVTSLIEEIPLIKIIIWENNNSIEYFHNPNSYSQFFELADKSKIILNCINTGLWSDQWYWSTWLLPLMWWNNIILSKKTSFYKKYISEWKNWFFYTDYKNCLKKINYILWLDNDKINHIIQNRNSHFLKNKQIENYCEDIFYS